MQLTSEARVLEIRGECYADDVPMHSKLTSWSEAEVEAYFSSGGITVPPSIDVSDNAMPSHSKWTDTSDSTSEQTQEQPHAAPTPPDDPEDSIKAKLSSLSIKELKARCAAAGLQTDDCLAKSDLVRRAMEAPHQSAPTAPVPDDPTATATGADEAWWADLPTKDIKRRLEQHGIDTAGCFERPDFEALAIRHQCTASSPTRANGATAGAGGRPPAPSDAAAVSGDWESYSTKALRQLLTERHVSTAGCLNRGDLIATAEAHRATLLAAVPTPVSREAHVVDAQRAVVARQKEERRRAGLEALGGVVHGGYQIDMFSVKRGRCLHNTKCFRYMPPNVKVNGCAMPGMGAVTCRRCGYSNMDHEDLGRWEEGDPMLVDEHGDGWRFEACVDGTRKVKMEPPPRNR